MSNMKQQDQNMTAQNNFVNQSLNAGLTINQAQISQMLS